MSGHISDMRPAVKLFFCFLREEMNDETADISDEELFFLFFFFCQLCTSWLNHF